ncbi:MAG: hypothetical protein K2I86_06475 [Prevotella sp.]|nr:hypothetical protein [Prevotella sp.]
MVRTRSAHDAECVGTGCGHARHGMRTRSARGADVLRMGSALGASGRGASVLMIKGGRP